MSLQNLKNETIKKYSEAGIAKSEAAAEFNLLLKEILGITKKDFFLNSDKKLDIKDVENFNFFINRRVKEKIPVQYLINKAYFMGKDYFVDERVLIPRPETEILVQEVVNLFPKGSELKILDIATGSGCIACSIAKTLLKSKVMAIDISEKALDVAKINAEKFNLKNITFFQKDILETSNLDEKFDLIISNPPYIPKSQKSSLQPEILLHEPHEALFAKDNDGIEFYEKIIYLAANSLSPQGILAFEIGINQADKIVSILKSCNFSQIQLIKDFNQIERVIIAQFTGLYN